MIDPMFPGETPSTDPDPHGVLAAHYGADWRTPDHQPERETTMSTVFNAIKAGIELAAYKIKFKLDELTDRLCAPLRGDVDPFDLGDALDTDDPHGYEPDLAEVEEFRETVAPVAGFDPETVRRYAEAMLGAELLPWQARLIDQLGQVQR